MALGAVRIVLEAVDKYSSTLLGLNQGLELATKAFDVINFAAQKSFDAFASLAGSFNEVGNQFEQIGVKMETIFGGKGPAKEALDWAAEFGAKTPLTLDEVARSMIKLKTFGFDPFDGTLQAIGDAAFALGSDFDGIVTALGQMQLKGKVSAEELMQLAERNIPVYDILRERFNLTADQLGDIGRQGLDVNEAVKAIVQGLDQRFSGAMAKASNTAQGAFSTISDIVTVFQKNILDAGVWDSYVRQIIRVRDALSETLGSEIGQDLARSIGTIFNNILIVIEATVKAVSDSLGIDINNALISLTKSFSVSGENIKAYSISVIQSIFSVYNAVGTTVNQTIELFQRINSGNVLTSVVDGFINAVITGSDVIARITLAIVDVILNGIEKIATSVELVLRDVEGVQGVLDKLGIDIDLGNITTSVAGVVDLIEGTRESLPGLAESFSNTLESASGASDRLFNGFNQGLDSFKVNLDGVGSIQNNIIDQIKNINFEPAAKSVDDFIKKQEEVKIPDISSQAVDLTKSIESAVKKGGKKGLQNLKDLYVDTIKQLRTESDLPAAARNDLERQAQSLKAEISKITNALNLEKDILKGLDAGLGSNSQTKKNIKETATAVSVLEKEYTRLLEKLQKGEGFGGAPLSLFEKQDIEKQIADLRQKLGKPLKGELSVDFKDAKTEALNDILDRVGSVNWPAAWQQMADAFLQMLVAAAAGENIPLAITNYTPL